VSDAVDPRELHHDTVVVDAHNDLPVLLVLRNRELGDQGVARYWSERWVPEARAGGVDVQVLPIYVAPEVAEVIRLGHLVRPAPPGEPRRSPDVFGTGGPGGIVRGIVLRPERLQAEFPGREPIGHREIGRNE